MTGVGLTQLLTSLHVCFWHGNMLVVLQLKRCQHVTVSAQACVLCLAGNHVVIYLLKITCSTFAPVSGCLHTMRAEVLSVYPFEILLPVPFRTATQWSSLGSHGTFTSTVKVVIQRIFLTTLTLVNPFTQG